MHEHRDEMQNFPNEMLNHIIQMNRSASKTNETTTKTTKNHLILSSHAPNYDIQHFKQKARSWMLRAL